ncbi:hypothetical protein ACMFMG_005663 [Clarireedia jacksonii]
MRFLCLHGMGTSPEIFRIQTASLRTHLASSLPPSSQPHTYDFLPGAYPTAPAPGITPFFPDGPYLSHFPDSHSSSDPIQSALRNLSNYLSLHSPYDGVIAFSQGCTLLSTYLLSLSHQTPPQPAPFKFAIFICGGPSLSFLHHSLGIAVPAQAYSLDSRSRTELTNTARKFETVAYTNPEAEPVSIDYWGESARAAGSVIKNGEGEDYGVVIPDEKKIGIKTVHILGTKDPRRLAGRCLVGLCREEERRVWEFEGGHEVPRRGECVERMGALVEWAVGKGV